jgi:S1-C subfamily serine protease
MKFATWLLAVSTLFLAAAPARAQEEYAETDQNWAPSLVCTCVGEPCPHRTPASFQDEKEALKKKILEDVRKQLKEEMERILKEIEKLIDDEIAKAKGKKPDGEAPPAAPPSGKPGFLGIQPSPEQPTEEELKELKIEGGVRIQLIEGAAAEKAGLQDEDILLEIDGAKIKDFVELRQAVQKKTEGTEVKLKVLRGKKTKDYTVKLGPRPAPPGEPPPSEPPKEPPKPEGKTGSLGVKPGEATGKGMQIGGVIEGSPAAKAGIKEGDVLAKIDSTPIWKEDDLADFMKTTKAGQEVEVTLLRDGKEVKLKIKLAERK